MSLRDQVFHEILTARQRVYAVGQPSPLELLHLPIIEAEVWVKREDLSPVHSYKWRGAYNKMAQLPPDARERGVVAASAGNHAQGVALAARKLGIPARIYMPVSAPRMKQSAVKRHGQNLVEVIMHGDSYSDAYARAQQDVQESHSAYIHAYDDLGTMGGQGTLADEVVMSGHGPFDVAYLQIGGGGMASAVSTWLKSYFPGIRIVGVQGVGQASMVEAFTRGGPVALDYVDVFCDGTAVKKAGELTYALCRELLDELITVTNEEVCAAIQLMWEATRCIPEPSGAMGLAGLMKQQEQVKGRRVLTVLSGSNLDFGQLAWISAHAGIGGGRRRYMRFEIPERPGGMLYLLDNALEGVNIIEFQYGKVHESKAWPVIGFEASPLELEMLTQKLREIGVNYEDVTSEADVEFRIIRYEPALFRHPYFITLEFPERPGALHDFLAMLRGRANICYFNYTFTGELVGHALLGFEFDSEDARDAFKKLLADSKHHWREIPAGAVGRIL